MNKFRYWFVPEGWANLAYRCIVNMGIVKPKVPKVQFDIEKLQTYKGRHTGERCFILASGPSINKLDLKPLAKEHCIAVSQFFLHPDIEAIRPEYHCFAPQHAPFNDETNKIIFDNYNKHYTFPVECFIGTVDYEYSYYNYLKKHPEYNIDAAFISYQAAPVLTEYNHTQPNIWEITKHPFAIRTVIYTAIQVAYYMGFSEIYLLGVDHDYLSDINRTSGHHFYDDKKSFSDAEHLSQISREQWFHIYYTRWKEYRLMKEFLETQNVQIYNASPNSVLDVFPCVDYNSIVK